MIHWKRKGRHKNEAEALDAGPAPRGPSRPAPSLVPGPCLDPGPRVPAPGPEGAVRTRGGLRVPRAPLPGGAGRQIPIPDRLPPPGGNGPPHRVLGPQLPPGGEAAGAGRSRKAPTGSESPDFRGTIRLRGGNPPVGRARGPVGSSHGRHRTRRPRQHGPVHPGLPGPGRGGRPYSRGPGPGGPGFVPLRHRPLSGSRGRAHRPLGVRAACRLRKSHSRAGGAPGGGLPLPAGGPREAAFLPVPAGAALRTGGIRRPGCTGAPGPALGAPGVPGGGALPSDLQPGSRPGGNRNPGTHPAPYRGSPGPGGSLLRPDPVRGPEGPGPGRPRRGHGPGIPPGSPLDPDERPGARHGPAHRPGGLLPGSAPTAGGPGRVPGSGLHGGRILPGPAGGDCAESLGPGQPPGGRTSSLPSESP